MSRKKRSEIVEKLNSTIGDFDIQKLLKEVRMKKNGEIFQEKIAE